MTMRKIVRIDQERCNGCGECLPNCAEGALQIIDGKAQLIRDEYCDGLGACLGHCPQDAISIIERKADSFNHDAVQRHLADQKPQIQPTSAPHALETKQNKFSYPKSTLEQWPIQLKLVHVEAPFFQDSDLLVLADCVPVAYPYLHERLLKGRAVIIGCPKFDDTQYYIEKLSNIFRRNTIKSVLVAHMEVPCCAGLRWIVNQAVTASGKDIPIKQLVITIKGEIK
ncbi:MAG: 4Fe-4S dicluster domain-containing protein [Candidatus Bathyarchaeota archaeon]|nr:MAG: 4Fe-4S dicluster domain-containing protein [Candidatus Bathyarchaeota archaeon]